jgi:hypothetical protein
MNQYEAHHYTVTDEAITPTGKIERYCGSSAQDAASHCLYTHQLHEGHTHYLSGSCQIIVCPKHGQIAVVRSTLYEYLINGVMPNG